MNSRLRKVAQHLQQQQQEQEQQQSLLRAPAGPPAAAADPDAAPAADATRLLAPPPRSLLQSEQRPLRRLSAAQRARFSAAGFCIVPAFLSPPLLARVREALERRVAYEGSSSGWEGGHSGVARRLCNLMSKGDVFADLATDPLMLEAAHLSVGAGRRVIWNAMNFHDPVPGEVARQPLHADRAFFPCCRGYCNAIIACDAFTVQNGATRLVPGSHHRPWPNEQPGNRLGLDDGSQLWQPLPEPLGPAEGEIFAECAAGSVVLCHGDLWHGCCDNHSAGTRRSIHVGFACDRTRPQYEIAATIPDATRDRLQPLVEQLAPRRNHWWRVDYKSS
jgi:ectoine hydroxylase-related dioxygenase (phytanoyl-CoA dioxygenase family)|eukprot:COSAG01_NODE_1843_length_9071_cov_527.289122_9_plen_333_part_00